MSTHTMTANDVLDIIPTKGSKQNITTGNAEEIKSELQNIRERILKDYEDEFCKQLEEKNRELEQLMKELNATDTVLNDAIALKDTLNNNVENMEHGTPEDKETNDLKSKQLKELLQKRISLKNAIKKWGKVDETLQHLRKNAHNPLCSEVNKIDQCNESEEKNQCLLKTIAFLKYEIRKSMREKQKEEEKLNDRKLQLTVENELYEQKLKEIRPFMKKHDTEKILVTDRDIIKLVRHKLIIKEAELEALKLTVHDANQIINDMIEAIDEKQGQVNDYKIKCDHIQELLGDQDESTSDMRNNFQNKIESLNKEFVNLKSSLHTELKLLLPILSKLNVEQNKLKKNEHLLHFAESKNETMKRDLDDLKDRCEKLYEKINCTKKNEPSNEQIEETNKEKSLWLNDIEVKDAQQTQLKEKIQKLKNDMKKMDIILQDKQKELCTLKMTEKDLRETLLEQYQHKIMALADTRDIGNTEADLKEQKKNLEEELQTIRKKLTCKIKEKTKTCT